MKLYYSISLFTIVLVGLWACKHKPPVHPQSIDHFPAAVGRIVTGTCATAGCHNVASYTAAGGLLLDTWEHLFDGGNAGAVVVPYSVDYSSLLYFINVDSTLGPVAEPTMPLNHPPLSKEEYLLIRDWIANGAPDKDGNIAFSSNAPHRQKIYEIHQGCDMVAVIDAEKHVVMRYVPIGKKPYPESATYIRNSSDGNFAYVCCWYSDDVYKIDTHTDRVVATFNVGNSFWSAMDISDDGKKLVLTNGDSYDLVLINTETGEVQTHTNTGFINPHGITSNAAFNTFYVTSLEGNTIYKFSNGNTEAISIDGKPRTTTTGLTPDPYEIIMSPDYSKYYVACQNSHELRVFDASNDKLIKVIPVGTQPQGMTFASTKPYLFLSCMEDAGSNSKFKGTVYVINYNTFEIVKRISGKSYQPHTVAINTDDNSFYIFSRNQNYDGPAPHHQGPCSGRNGYYEVYDLSTLEPKVDKRFEVLVDPFVSDVRFK